MGKPTDVRPVAVALYFLPVQTRTPLKFGAETLTSITCARVRLTVSDGKGRCATGWGETPLSVQWVWPSRLSYEVRHSALMRFCIILAEAWASFAVYGHPIEVGYDFQRHILPELLRQYNAHRGSDTEPMPWLAAITCCSAFDIALHDAYGMLHQTPVYQTYNAEFMNRNLAHFLVPAQESAVSFQGLYPQNYLVPRCNRLTAWHLVGGLDPLKASELHGDEPADGYPVLLADWIERDGLKCLKVKLRGNDAEWDYRRLVSVGELAAELGVVWLSVDFNCMVTDPAYVTTMLDRLQWDHPRIYGMILYVEQPFPYDLESNRIDVHGVSARKPLFMDESAHDWQMVSLGRQLGWSGVALKTCKTQTGALLTLCWAKAHGLTLMVQDLTNPMLAQISHVLLAAYAGTIAGVETNAPQFYPDASCCEEAVHGGLYRRRSGAVDLSTVQGPGIGYRITEIRRDLPPPVTACEA